MPSEPHAALQVFGLASCDSCRKARKWLDARDLTYDFRDLRKVELSADRLRTWLASEPGQRLLNRRSATWRQLSDADKRAADTDPLSLLQRFPTLIKRPVITRGDAVLTVGFSPAHLENLL